MGIGHSIGFSLFLIEDRAYYDNRNVLEPLSQLILYGLNRFMPSHLMQKPARKKTQKQTIKSEGAIGAETSPAEPLISSTKNREVVT